MRIQMCDACKEIYTPYSKLTETGGAVREGNGLSLLVIDRDGKKWPKLTKDLCPNCMQKLHSFLNDELGIDTSKTYKQNNGEIGVQVASADPEDEVVSGGSVTNA